MKLDKEQVLKDIKEFICKYQSSLWSSDTMKFDSIVPIITVNDLIHKFNYDCSLKEFKEFISKHDDIYTLVNDFISNNYIHYCSSVKLKELLQEYKDANIMIEPNAFEFDISSMTTYNDIGISLNSSVSINSNLKSDLNNERTNQITKDIDKFDD